MLLMFSVFVFVVAVDQGSKAFVAARLQEGTATLGNVFGMRLRHVVNRRRPWGSPVGVRVMTIAWLILIAAGCVSASIVHNTAGYIAVGTIMAGATGNLIDGVSRHAVTDFIDLRVWPVFNVADTAIVAGATIIVWNAARFLWTR